MCSTQCRQETHAPLDRQSNRSNTLGLKFMTRQAMQTVTMTGTAQMHIGLNMTNCVRSSAVGMMCRLMALGTEHWQASTANSTHLQDASLTHPNAEKSIVKDVLHDEYIGSIQVSCC